MKNKTLKRLCVVPLILLCIFCMPVASFASETKTEDKTVTVRLPVSCVGVNTTEKFVYELTGETTEFQTVESKTLTLQDKEKGEFRIIYSYPGTYHYTVVQHKGNDDVTSYDGTVYRVDVYVTENEKGIMHAEPVIYQQGKSEKEAELSFRNEKQLPDVSEKHPAGIPEKQPKTGDDTPLALWALLMLVSGVSVIVIWRKGITKNRGDHHA